MFRLLPCQHSVLSEVFEYAAAQVVDDVLQARLIEPLSAVRVVQHDTFQHNVPMHLEREGLLVPLLKRELLALMLDTEGLRAT